MRFKSTIDEDIMDIMPYLVYDNEEEAFYNLQGCIDLLNEYQNTINELKEENEKLIQNKCIPCELVNLQTKEIDKLKEENKQLFHKLQQIEEYLQIKIDECKNHKKMKEIEFGVEQAKGYEKALLQFQKGLKRRWNDD